MVSAAMIILATRSSSVSTTVSYTRSPDLPCLDFFLWGHMKQLVYETVVETEEGLVARITVAAGTIADIMPGIFEWTLQSMIRRCTSCIQYIRAVPVNTTAAISMLNYLLCKSSLESETAVRDHIQGVS